MARTAVPAGEGVIVAGRPERVAVVRAFAAALLGGQHRQADTVVLLVSELATNSIRHSRSGQPGQTVTVTFTRAEGVLRVAVTDCGGASVPRLQAGDTAAEGSRGLALVAALAIRWGVDHRDGCTKTWFEVQDR